MVNFLCFFIYLLAREIQQQGLFFGYDNFNNDGVFVIGNKTLSKMSKGELFFWSNTSFYQTFLKKGVDFWLKMTPE